MPSELRQGLRALAVWQKPVWGGEAVPRKSILQRTLRGSCISAGAGLALLAAARPAAAWSASCESAQRYTLRNGLEVVLVPEARVPAVALVSSVHAGSRDDPEGHRGLAHYVEHLTFIGTPPFTSAMDLYEEIGAIGLNATLSHIPPATGRLALVTQSSAIARAVLDWAAAEAVGFSHVIGIGGNQGQGFAGALDWLARDPGTGAILLDIRRIKNRRMFISAARAAAASAGSLPADAVFDDALSALVNLGYQRNLAEKALKQAVQEGTEVSVQKLLRKSLQLLAK